MIEYDDIIEKPWSNSSEPDIFLADNANGYDFTKDRLFKETDEVFDLYPGLSSHYYFKLINKNRTMLDVVENRLIPDVSELYRQYTEDGTFKVENFDPSEDNIRKVLMDEAFFAKWLKIDHYEYLDRIIQEVVTRY